MSSQLVSKDFWAATAERSVKTFAQALIAAGVSDATGVLGFDWGEALSVSAMAFVLSVLTCVASAGVGDPGPSLANESVQPALDPPKAVE